MHNSSGERILCIEEQVHYVYQEESDNYYSISSSYTIHPSHNPRMKDLMGQVAAR